MKKNNNLKLTNINSDDGDTIDLREYYKKITKNFRSFFTIIAIILIILIVYYFNTKPLYSSYVSIYPISKENSINTTLSDISGIASSFGFNIGKQSGDIFYIPDIIDSRKLKKTIINQKWESTTYSKSINLIDYWNLCDENNFSLIKIIKNLFSSEMKDIDSQSICLEQAIDLFTDRIEITEDDSGLIKIVIIMEEAKLASDIANFIAEYIKIFISEEVLINNRAYRNFIQSRLNESKLDLQKVENKLTDFRKKYPIVLDTPDLQLERGRLLRDVMSYQEIYLTLLAQFEIAKLEELKESPVINILDKAEPAVEKIWPKLLHLIFFGIIFGSLFSIFFIFVLF